MTDQAGAAQLLRPFVLDALDGADGRAMSVASVRGYINYRHNELWPHATVALALEGLVRDGIVDRVKVQSHGGAVTRVRYRVPAPEQQTMF